MLSKSCRVRGKHFLLPSAASPGQIGFSAVAVMAIPHPSCLLYGTHIKGLLLNLMAKVTSWSPHCPVQGGVLSAQGMFLEQLGSPSFLCSPCSHPFPDSVSTLYPQKSFCLKYSDLFLFPTLNSDPHTSPHHQCWKFSIFFSISGLLSAYLISGKMVF